LYLFIQYILTIDREEARLKQELEKS